jgi:hypothetical protein
MRKRLILIPLFAAIAAFGSSSEKGPALARIDGETFTEGDLDLRLSAYDDARREEILKDPEQRRREFANLLRTRLYSRAALQSPHGKSGPLRRRIESVDQRVITQYYFETYLGANAGFTRREIEAYYNANPALFRDSAGAQPLWRVQSQILDSLIVAKVNLDSFYDANKAGYVTRASVEPAIIQTATRKQAEAALKALKGGMSFSAAAAKYSTLASKDQGGAAPRLSKGEFQYDIGSQAVVDSLFFGPKRLLPGKHSGIIAKDGGFVIVSVKQYVPEATPPLAAVRAQVVGDYVRSYKGKLQQDVVNALKAKHQARLVSRERVPSEAEIRAYYDGHKENYESPETFELYHVEMASEAKLNAALASVKDLAQFKALAAKASENALTKGQDGYLGVVKRDFSLPYGIGTIPSLFTGLDTISSGKLPELVQNPMTQTWHAFWLAKKGPRQLKPLERVRSLVVEEVKANSIQEIKPADTLAVIGTSGTVIRESDVLFLRQEIPDQMQERYTRENLVDYLLIWRVFTDEATALGLDQERKLRAQRAQNQEAFWERIYVDSVLSRAWNEDPALLAKTFKANRSVFTADTSSNWKPYARDIAAYLRLTPKDFDIEYRTNPDRYRRDTVAMTFAEARGPVFQSLKPVAYARLDARVLDGLKKRYKVTILDASLNEPSLEPVAATYKKAQDLHYERKLDQSLALYEKLRVAYPNNAGLQDSISFGMAQIYIEQERYPQAMAEYRRVSYLYPKSPNDYKAMFMVGFIYAEHLKQDSAAVQAFEALIKKYPNSDLTDDADWMVRNIRSGGQLMPPLEEEPAIKEEEPQTGK